jgi:uncharacterized membrane protein
MATGRNLLPALKNELRAVRTALWVRPAAYCFAAAAASATLATIEALLPQGSLRWLPPVEVGTAIETLKLLATGMMTVATVTLSVLMLVLSMAAGQFSPRAVPELMADPVTQNALGTFLATFVYALAALLLFGFEVVTGRGVTLVFIAGMLLAVNALRYMVQWIHHIAEILKLNHIIHRINSRAEEVLETYLALEVGGDRAEPEEAAGPWETVRPEGAGYVQLIDEHQLWSLARDHSVHVRLCIQEGDFVHPHSALLEVRGATDEALAESLRATVVIGYDRSHEGDPRLGFELLAEVACRALSPGINDPQSAVACIHYLGGLLSRAGSAGPRDYPPERSEDGRVRFVRAGFADLLERAYRPIMRDGAHSAEVICGIMEQLKDLAARVDPAYLDNIVAEADRALRFGEEKLTLEVDRAALQALDERLRERAAGRRRSASAAR